MGLVVQQSCKVCVAIHFLFPGLLLTIFFVEKQRTFAMRQ